MSTFTRVLSAYAYLQSRSEPDAEHHYEIIDGRDVVGNISLNIGRTESATIPDEELDWFEHGPSTCIFLC